MSADTQDRLEAADKLDEVREGLDLTREQAAYLEGAAAALRALEAEGNVGASH
ncbi:hypothetical protein ACFTWF_03160 [Rhodococcus sp. NPDC056960]|uniref:hypothetical protein n=1 Tax=Rhodococcus sp. NPDC056960 TaxID=3345982 RepID=UPI00363724C2